MQAFLTCLLASEVYCPRTNKMSTDSILLNLPSGTTKHQVVPRELGKHKSTRGLTGSAAKSTVTTETVSVPFAFYRLPHSNSICEMQFTAAFNVLLLHEWGGLASFNSYVAIASLLSFLCLNVNPLISSNSCS